MHRTRKKRLSKKAIADMWRMYFGKLAGFSEVYVLHRFFKDILPSASIEISPDEYLQFWSENLYKYFPKTTRPYFDITSGQALEIYIKQKPSEVSIIAEPCRKNLKIFNTSGGINAWVDNKLITDEDRIFEIARDSNTDIAIVYYDLAEGFFKEIDSKGLEPSEYLDTITSLRGRFKNRRDLEEYVRGRLCQ